MAKSRSSTASAWDGPLVNDGNLYALSIDPNFPAAALNVPAANPKLQMERRERLWSGR